MVLDPTKGGNLKIPNLPDHTNDPKSEFDTEGLTFADTPNIIGPGTGDSYANAGAGSRDTEAVKLEAPSAQGLRGSTFRLFEFFFEPKKKE